MLLWFMLAVGMSASGQLPAPPDTPPPLTLSMALARAKTSSPLRGAAERLVEGTAASARLAGRALNPQVDVRGENWTPSASTSLPIDLFATLSQPLELGGKRRTRLELASAEHGLAASSLAGIELQVTLRTTQLYVQALKARGLLATLTANRDGLAMLVDTMRRRVDEGRSAEADLLKFAAESARVDIDVARARLDLDRSLQLLAFTIGSPAPLAAGELVEPDSIAPPSPTVAAIAAAAVRHPDAALSAARLERARRAAAVEHARRVPDAIVTGGYKRTAGIDTLLAGVTMTVPLFDRNGSAAARADGEARAAAAEHDAVVRRIASDTTALVEIARTLSDRARRAASELLQPAGVVRDASLATFREGAADVMRLIDAERVYADVRRTALELRLEALTAVLEARVALGEEPIP
jgi:cobalt-zinc-cadmium efflux system outer membrane protein